MRERKSLLADTHQLRCTDGRGRKLANSFAKQILLGTYPSWAETSRGRCRLCRRGRSNGEHTSGVRRFQHRRWMSYGVGKLGCVIASEELCVLCAMDSILEKGATA